MSQIHKIAPKEVSFVNDSLMIKIKEKDPKTVQKMQAQGINPKDLRCKPLLAKIANRESSARQKFGGDTRARLRAKLTK